MSDLRIIPAEPWAEARETYRRFAAEDRPGDPWAVPFEPRPRRRLSAIVWSLVAVALVSLWWIV